MCKVDEGVIAVSSNDADSVFLAANSQCEPESQGHRSILPLWWQGQTKTIPYHRDGCLRIVRQNQPIEEVTNSNMIVRQSTIESCTLNFCQPAPLYLAGCILAVDVHPA